MSRVLVALFVAFAVLMPVGAIAAAESGQVVHALQQPPTNTGPDIPPAPTEQDGAKSRERLVIGIAAALLLTIVILGHRVRRRRRKNAGG